MASRSSSLRRLTTLPVLFGLLILALSCAKEPTPAENSITPPQFTPEKFAAVQIGQTQAAVEQSIGKPFGYYDVGEGRKRFVFSQPKDKTKKYLAYDVVIGADGKVVDKSVFSLYEE